MNYKFIPKDEIKEGQPVQYVGVYILNKKQLEEAGIEIDGYFVEEEEK